MDRELYGLVLAGGKSRRMGSDKALLQRGGKSQLAYLYELVAAVTSKTFVSARRDQQDEPQRAQYPQIVDRYDDIGPAAGILSAMDACPDVDWLVVACDLPNIERGTLEFLLAARGQGSPFVAYRSSHDNLPEPLCALYLEGAAAIVRGFVDEGSVCPRKMLIRSNTLLLEQPDPAALDNINTREDLQGSVLEARS